MTDYAVLFFIVVGVNLMPAFGPPTWTVLVWYRFTTELPTVGLVLVGASAAALGRYLLARLFRLLSDRLSGRSQRNLEAARAALESRKRNVVLALALFATSPIPSAALFEAAGLARMRLLAFTAVFFLGRLVSYSVFTVGAAEVRHTGVGQMIRENLTSPIGIAVQIALLAGLVAITRIDWAKRLGSPPPKADFPDRG